ncbi:hypothetical protein LEN26_019693 [Aphanomyces euteiches]|nr:hypothetical protein LEN26_019693 [Aphanomyces euteiches]
MQHSVELGHLRDAIHALLEENEESNQEEKPLMHASEVCMAIEACLKHGLKRVSSKETVSLWGLLQWTNVSQLERHKVWKIHQEKLRAKEQSKEWYLDMFKDELEQISTLKLKDNNPPTNDHSDDNPLTPGFQASIRTVNSLLHVQTPDGRVRAWIRHCLNTHILSRCLTAIMHPMNEAALCTYFAPGALCCDVDMREILVGLTSTLDRLHFGFPIDNRFMDNPSLPEEPQDLSNEPLPQEPAVVNQVLLDVLDAKTQQLHELLKNTPASILSPRADEVRPGQPRGGIFGAPLVDLVQSSGSCDVATWDCAIGVPNIIEGCCRLVDAAAAVGIPALFASKVHKTRFQQLVQQVEISGTLSIWSSAHHGIIILIKWLRDLPEPIFPLHLIPHFLAVIDMGEALQILELRNLVNQLHWSVKPTLLRLVYTLSRVVKCKEAYNSHVEKIDAIPSLAASATTVDLIYDIFGRILFPKQSTSLPAQTTIVRLLIAHTNSIFVDISSHIMERTKALIDRWTAVERIADDIRTPFDPSLHQPLFDQLREHYPNIPSPETLRGGGILVFNCLIHFAHEHQELAIQLIAQRVLGDAKQYPLPVASVHIVRMLVELLQLQTATSSQTIVDIDVDAWFARCDGYPSTNQPITINSSLALVHQGLWSFFHDSDAFYRLFGWTVLLFDRNYTRSGASCMDFTTILAETRVQVVAHLEKKPRSVPELYQLWAESLETNALVPRTTNYSHGIDPIRIVPSGATAHMQTYVVIWDGGVTIRSYPSKQADIVGVREQGDHIDTVLQAGHWLKLRDLPGGQGGGWILAKSQGKTLVQLVDPTMAV